MGIFDFLNDIFGDNASNQALKDNIQVQKDLLNRQTKFEDELGAGLQENIKNPGNFINNIAKQYEGSDYQKYISDEANTALNNNLRATGLNGSSYGLGAIARLNAGIAGAGLGDFIKNSLGGYGTGLSGLINSRNGSIQIGSNFDKSSSNFANNRTDIWKILAQLGNKAGKAFYDSE